MALINHRAREIHFKIVYYGPGLGGKTTNLRVLHDWLPAERRGRMVSIATDNERTLFFDFLPLELGQVNGFTTRFHLYTVPGQVYYRLSRRAVLQGVDGVVFVADSHPARELANRESLTDLYQHLASIGLTPAQIGRLPRVYQYNKRDSECALPVERLRSLLNPESAQEFEAVACEGRGVNETLKAICKAVLARLTTEPATESSGPMPVLVMRRPGRAALAAARAEAEAAGAAMQVRPPLTYAPAAGAHLPAPERAPVPPGPTPASTRGRASFAPESAPAGSPRPTVAPPPAWLPARPAATTQRPGAPPPPASHAPAPPAPTSPAPPLPAPPAASPRRWPFFLFPRRPAGPPAGRPEPGPGTTRSVDGAPGEAGPIAPAGARHWGAPDRAPDAAPVRPATSATSTSEPAPPSESDPA